MNLRTSTEKAEETLQDEVTDFRALLQNEFLKRCRVNPKYSLRSFARFLRLDPSTLSQILRGTRPISPQRKTQLGVRLGLGPTTMARFEQAEVRSQGEASAPKTQPHELTIDAFQVIADWYHYAIFELVTIADFRSDSKWIAKRLGISVPEVNIAVERLFRLELLRQAPDGRWQQGAKLLVQAAPYTNVAFRRLQGQVLKMALDALENVPIERRDQSSMTFAIHSRRIPEAQERITKFRREICEFLQQDVERDAVYQLGISLYPLTSANE